MLPSSARHVQNPPASVLRYPRCPRSGGKVKLAHLHNRFFVGAIGNNTILHAARATAYVGPESTLLRGARHTVPDSIDGLCLLINRVSPIVAENLESSLKRAVQDGRRSNADYEQLLSQRSLLLVIDYLRFKIVLIDFGQVFPKKTTYSFTIEQLALNKAHRCGIDEPLVIGDVSKFMLEHPYKWCEEQLEAARSYLKERDHSDVLGDLGACFRIRGNKLEARSAFATIEDMVRAYWPVRPEPPGDGGSA